MYNEQHIAPPTHVKCH